MAKSTKIYFPETLQGIVESKGSIPVGVEIPVVIRIRAFRPDKNYQEDEPIYEVFLPVPTALNNSYAVEFENLEIGVIGEMLGGLVNAASKFDGFGDDGKSFITEEIPDAAAALGEGVIKAGARFLDTVGALSIPKRKFGFSFNKFSEMSVSKPSNRTFSFSFDLAPSSKSEATVAENIVKIFKLGMQPTTEPFGQANPFSGGQGSLGAPKTTFQTVYRNPLKYVIDFNFKGKSGYNKLFKTAPCFITSFNVNYHRAGAPSYLVDGQPTMMSIDLSMTEIFPLNRDSLAEIEGINELGPGTTPDDLTITPLDLLNPGDERLFGSEA